VSRHSEITSPNIAGILRGSDPVLREQYVVYTAHADHLGIGPPVNGDSELLRAVAGRRSRPEPLGRLPRPTTAAKKSGQIRKLHRAGVSKAEIARRLEIGRTSVRRILA
jgi:hypothetical protein